MFTRQGQDKLFTATMWKSPVKLSKALVASQGKKRSREMMTSSIMLI